MGITIYKLIKVVKSRPDEIMIAVLTKLSILSACCITSFVVSFGTMFAAISMMNMDRLSHATFFLMGHLIFACDTFVNFSSVFLSFTFAVSYYEKTCGCLDFGCKKVCKWFVAAPKEEEAIRHNMKFNIQMTMQHETNTA